MASNISKAQLLHEADSLEASAKESLAAWTVLGQASKYGRFMDRAACLRAAAALRTPSERNLAFELCEAV